MCPDVQRRHWNAFQRLAVAAARLDHRAERRPAWRLGEGLSLIYMITGAFLGVPFEMPGVYFGAVLGFVLSLGLPAYGDRLIERSGGRAIKYRGRAKPVYEVISAFESRLKPQRVADARLILAAGSEGGGAEDMALGLVLDDLSGLGGVSSAELELLTAAARRVGITPELREGLLRLGAIDV